jgi:hypothetical protein
MQYSLQTSTVGSGVIDGVIEVVGCEVRRMVRGARIRFIVV